VDQDKQETLEQQARRVRKAILVRQVQQGILGLSEIRVVQDRLVTAGQQDQQDRQVIQAQRDLRVLTARLEAQVSQARQEILAIRDPSGSRATPVPPAKPE